LIKNIQIVILFYLHSIYIELSEFLLKKKIKISEATGFGDEKLKYAKLNFLVWFLTSKNRHLWRHHYLGTQGIILVFSSKSKNLSEKEKLIYETLNIFKDLNLINVPFLILFDKSEIYCDEEVLIGLKLKEELQEGNFFFNTQYINFDDKKAIEEIFYGLDWLSSVMQPIK
jgi:GTPase SAR1 family protein